MKDYIKTLNKQKEYKSDVKIEVEEFKMIDGISAPQLKQDIAIQI